MSATQHPHEGMDCPYCDGTLSQINDWENPLECSNGGDCPATFVAIFGGTASRQDTETDNPGRGR